MNVTARCPHGRMFFASAMYEQGGHTCCELVYSTDRRGDRVLIAHRTDRQPLAGGRDE